MLHLLLQSTKRPLLTWKTKQKKAENVLEHLDGKCSQWSVERYRLQKEESLKCRCGFSKHRLEASNRLKQTDACWMSRRVKYSIPLPLIVMWTQARNARDSRAQSLLGRGRQLTGVEAVSRHRVPPSWILSTVQRCPCRRKLANRLGCD